MSDEKTSPGPWHVDEKDVRAADGTTVCRADWNVNDDDGSAQRWAADAAFIASASTLRGQRDRAVALLRKLQWSDMTPLSALPRCPSCMSTTALGHAKSCDLAAFLAEVDAFSGTLSR